MLHPKQGVPVFKLYGENYAWHTPDLLHCESIPERSRLHGWEIRQHRHADLGQLLYVQGGRAMLDVEGHHTRIDRPSILVIPPMCVHGFTFSRNIAGYVITLAAPLLEWLNDNLTGVRPALLNVGCYPVGADKPYVDLLCTTLNGEYASQAPNRDFLLRSLAGALAVWIGRQQIEQHAAAARPGRAEGYLAAFNRLVEQHYREQWPVNRYASRLGITAVYLNGICRRLTRHSALETVHQRLLLEAKRNLVYTSLTIAQIADVLGFSEAAYFSRFFKRLTGASPREFRSEIERAGRQLK
ncbi:MULTISPECIES: helix-turn-helix domain-containing protein [Burkholderia]|uniref:Helix-turn-helix domain-containing protein n=2 Tax=Burkholderia cepacia complex TaxID=87882 RepID=A0AAP2HPX8_9BURK|nr:MULTISPECIES: helix-turn-helix domain-containing protein [Burkholderia]EED99738.1 regulatory protein [Burkholderia multivorans CGD1]MBR8428390.1 helix-turn-helix domain-containing protein [Burkholderia cenocepacia]MBU9360489.1 helix-turn-helix domain-containing protein [Burkholderia multivorans]MDN7669385.1 helix-turn-helix domain-containing protein [Burkholderia vietnamiensis]MDR8730517.1 HTH-type transcriptional activator RhaS [Burkholderia pseudomultivorans]